METQSLTEAQNRLIHAYVEPGGHWHEGIKRSDGTVSVYRCSCMEHQSIDPIWRLNPTYTDDAPFSNFQRVLFGEEGMWGKFGSWVWHKYDSERAWTNVIWFVEWLFHPDHRDRFLRLFIEFLGLPETQRDFGYTECPQYIQSRHSSSAECALKGTERCENDCGDTGQVPRPWLKVWKGIIKEDLF